ncbi:Eco57I restriction-modification methylase domain-containing protein [Actinoplanes sp. G11-F43]|uniref:Eco57I restriction-modification methylase domain-containing protein n=1 Tax=Actinoplanes sp. G11-F43 TaxID=3424130 RepID=UPI003D33DBFE
MSAGLPGAALRAAHATVTRLAAEMPTAAAVGWVHTAALVRHALDNGLVDDHGSLPATLAALAGAHPALTGLADPHVNRALTVSAPELTPVEDLWRAHPIPDPPYRPDGRSLGDLYQALSAESRKSRALCQTPQFVSDLLWDLTVPDAVTAFGPGIRLIDPACGTGHLLVEAAIRLPGALAGRPGGRHRSIEQALAAVHGVDIDPYAAQIARYRLLTLACRADGRRWTAGQAPADLPIQVAAADSLLDDAEPLLQRARYHVALANPPYITVKDPVANAAIRARYRQTCHGKFSLALPFMQLINELLVPGGFCAQLTANSFMKREFGRPFIEQYLPAYDLTWVIDTSGAYIPGHGTPTVILVHRNQPPASSTVTTIQSVRGEPAAPADPARGLVWTAIRQAVDGVLSARRFAAGAAAWAAAQQPDASAPPIVTRPRPAYQQPSLLDLLSPRPPSSPPSTTAAPV